MHDKEVSLSKTPPRDSSIDYHSEGGWHKETPREKKKVESSLETFRKCHSAARWGDLGQKALKGSIR